MPTKYSIFFKDSNISKIKTCYLDHYPIFYHIGWVTYFSSRLVDLIGRDKFDSLSHFSYKEEYMGGFFLSATEEPFDWESAEHRQKDELILDYLGLAQYIKND